MKHTDDTPRMLTTVTPTIPSAGPVFLSNHSQLGFNVRHFYQHWQTGEWRATKKGVAVTPDSAMILVKEMVEFINECDLYPGRTFAVVEVKDEDKE